MKTGITFCHDLQFEKGLFDSFEYAVSKGLVKSNWLQGRVYKRQFQPNSYLSLNQKKETRLLKLEIKYTM